MSIELIMPPLYSLNADNDFKDFERPEFYIRYIEPIEAELRVQVEYDMDEQGATSNHPHERYIDI